MLRFSRHPRSLIKVGALALLVFLSLFAAAPRALAQSANFAFTILGQDGAVARVITSEAACPQVTIDGTDTAMQVRAAPDQDFAVTVCDLLIPQSAKSASVNGQELKLPVGEPKNVVVIGDTGCRLSTKAQQSCNNPEQWPFKQIADSAAVGKPDLVIDVGDYHYREAPCVVDKADCAGSPFGDNWAAWDADFFTPGASLLQAAPWVIVPGNHEDCERAGIGFFRLLDPRPMPATCPLYTDPYALNYVNPQIIVVDNSAVDDFNIEPEQVAVFQKQLNEINKLAQGNSWLAIHDPIYVFGHLGEKDGKEQLFIDQLTIQQASNNTFPPSVQVLFSGHIHLYQVLSFDGTRPPQVVAGTGGTMLDHAVTTPLTGQIIGGMPVAFGNSIDQFGYVTLERNGEQWNMALRNVQGGELDKCTLANKQIACGQVGVPTSGSDWSLLNNWWLALGLVGAAIVFIGLALGMRSAARRRTV